MSAGFSPPPDYSVRIRMFRPGLGDCFLLTFPRDGDPFHVLIDCGVFLHTKDEAKRMRAVAEAVREVTSRLDVIVVTHEHYDHLCGFKHASDIFDRIEIGMVWMAWTEDPDDTEAQKLSEQFSLGMQALAAGFSRLSVNGQVPDPGMRTAHQVTEAVGGFFGIDSFGFSENMRAIRNSVATRVPESRRRYHEPGKAFELADLPEVRFYVLGPPRGALLKLINPVAGEGDSYRHALAPPQAFSMWSSLFDVEGGSSLADNDRLEAARPFESFQRISKEDLESYVYSMPDSEAERGRVLGRLAQLLQETEYDETGNQWRRIDSDWLQSTADLALQMNSFTNNTSLALAMEFTATGKVLLFPGDAQVGNWRSWHQLSFDTGGEPVVASDLLRRTVFYKVGHHGSHNATHRKLGLEQMTSPELVAMIPTDEKFALSKGPNGWKMPDPGVDEALQQKTRGRVLRADPIHEAQPAASEALDGEAFAKFLASVDEAEPDGEGRRLWIDYYVT